MERVHAYNHQLVAWAAAMLSAAWGVPRVTAADTDGGGGDAMLGFMALVQVPARLQETVKADSEQYVCARGRGSLSQANFAFLRRSWCSAVQRLGSCRKAWISPWA